MFCWLSSTCTSFEPYWRLTQRCQRGVGAQRGQLRSCHPPGQRLHACPRPHPPGGPPAAPRGRTASPATLTCNIENAAVTSTSHSGYIGPATLPRSAITSTSHDGRLGPSTPSRTAMMSYSPISNETCNTAKNSYELNKIPRQVRFRGSSKVCYTPK